MELDRSGWTTWLALAGKTGSSTAVPIPWEFTTAIMEKMLESDAQQNVRIIKI